MNTKELLEQRAKTHGDFDDNARVFAKLLNAVHDEYNTFNYVSAEDERKLTALNMIFIKIARIASTAGGIQDDWADIKGYCQLVLNNCYNDDSESKND